MHAAPPFYTQHCALCHGADGRGSRAAARRSSPARGARSFNWGAGMGDIRNAAGFIKANMPLGAGGTLTDQEAGRRDLHGQPRTSAGPTLHEPVQDTREVPRLARFEVRASVNGRVLGAP